VESFYKTIKPGTWKCKWCDLPVCNAGSAIHYRECYGHWMDCAFDPEGYWLNPIRLNTYQASNLLRCLETNPQLSTGDWWGELIILLRNNGITYD